MRAADLAQSSIDHADFSSANLEDANFYGARMLQVRVHTVYTDAPSVFEGRRREQQFDWSSATGNVSFRNAFARHANFQAFDGVGADFTNADLTNASFLGANLANAKFDGAMLQGANFCDANLFGVDLKKMEAQGAVLDGSRIKEPDNARWSDDEWHIDPDSDNYDDPDQMGDVAHLPER